MTDILVTGGSGQVGSYLKDHAWLAGIAAYCPPRSELDIADPGSIANVMAKRSFAAVINCAAYTGVDKSESDCVAAWRANALGPATLAAETAARNIPLLHVSTDYVFDGRKVDPYLPHDPVGPVSVYGASKEGGEQAVRTGNPRHVIVRTAWVVSPRGENFVKTMLRLGLERSHLRVVADQHGAPTHARDLAETLALMALAHLQDPDAPTGTFHFTNAGATTWHGVALAVFASAARFGRSPPTVEAIASAHYPTPARRPAQSRLDLTQTMAVWSLQPRPWREAIDNIVTELLD